MNKKKLFAVVISLALVIGVVLPGTLALSTDTDSSQTNATAEVPATPETPSETPAETLAPSEQPTEGTSEQPKQSTEEETPAPSETPKECTCDPKPAEGEAHKEGCPLYVAPEQPAEAEKTCTCDPKPAEGEAHKEGCPLYVKPVSNASKHIDTCTEGCTGEDCKCPCHLFDKIMACTTLEEIDAILETATDAEFTALTEEQNQKIEAKITALEPEPLPAVVIEESSDEPVPSEIIYPTVNFDEVAPFGDPVVGGEG